MSLLLIIRYYNIADALEVKPKDLLSCNISIPKKSPSDEN